MQAGLSNDRAINLACTLESLDLIKLVTQRHAAFRADEMPILGHLRLPIAADDRVRRCQGTFMEGERNLRARWRPAQLSLDRLPQVLQQVEAGCDLPSTLSVETASVPAEDLDSGWLVNHRAVVSAGWSASTSTTSHRRRSTMIVP